MGRSARWLLITACALIQVTDAWAQDKPPASPSALDDILPSGARLRYGTSKLRHGSRILTLGFSPNGRILAAGGGDDPVRLWDPHAGKEIRTLNETWVHALSFTPRGSMIATAGAFKVIRLWEVATGKESSKLEGHASAIKGLQFSPDGYTLASGGQDGTVFLWEFPAGKIITQFKGHSDEVSVLAFSPNSKRLASAGADHTIRIWDCDNDKHLLTLDGGCAVSALVFGPRGKTLFSAGDDHLIRIWNPADGKLLGTIKGHEGTIASLLLLTPEDIEDQPLPESKLVSAGRDGSIRIWDLAGKPLLRIARDLGDSDALAISRDGKLLASAGINNAIRVFETAAGKELLAGPGHLASVAGIALAADARALASISVTGDIKLWDNQAGKEIRRWPTNARGEIFLAFSPDGRTLVSGGVGDPVRFWDGATGKETMNLAAEPGDAVMSIAYSPDGSKLAAGKRQGGIALWDLGQTKIVQQFRPAGPVHALAFAHDGATLAAGGGSSIQMFDVASGQEKIPSSGKPPGPAISFPAVAALAFSPDGKMLAAACYDSLIRLIDPTTFKQLRVLEGHGTVAYAIAFSGDSRMLASASFDQTVRLWEAFSGLPVASFRGHRGPVTSLAMLKNGRSLFSGSADTTLIQWDATGLAKDGALPGLTLDEPEFKTAWLDLASVDAGRAHRAMWRAVAAGKTCAPQLERSLYFLDPKKIDVLFRDLNSEQYKIRTDATREIEKYGIWMKGRLQEMHKNPPTLEVQRRIDQMLAKLNVPGALTIEQERLRVRRVILALEQLGSPEALAILRKLASNGPENELQVEAAASLERLKREAHGTP